MADVVSEGRRLLADEAEALTNIYKRQVRADILAFADAHLAALLDCAEVAGRALADAEARGLSDATYWVRDLRAALARLEGETL